MNKLTDKIFIQTGKSALDSLLTNVTPQNTQGTGGGGSLSGGTQIIVYSLKI